ncbi:Biotinidase like protein [Argiope bruennichi]|uniref:Biotinidase like protein n=1 Tax=Argiope bruennichi TaxID=94029 RepID=A0A8T0G1Z2_ARGBR|nr:Biotinidase like protein [Argiope bruennichi]
MNKTRRCFQMEKKVDIIVFPEKGLFPMKMDNATWFLNYAEDIPDGSEEANPCNDDKFSNSPIIRNLSCIARKHNFFVAATLFDVKKCEVETNCKNRVNKNSCVTNSSDCPDSDYFYFNTLVVFNRRGTLIVRYYKRHPFTVLEKGVTTPKYPEPAYFDIGFAKFATDIGFDFLFNDSVIDIERRPSTKGISYANWWFDHTPFFYFSVPNQQAFCLTNKVTVLSSDVHSPNLGSLGSGIYLPGKGAVVYSYNPDGKSKLLISDVPATFLGSILDKNLNTKFFYIEDDDTVNELNGEEPRDFKAECGQNVLGTNPSSLTDYRCMQTEVHQYTFVKLNKTEDNINICSNNFCCSLEYQAESMNETFYFAVSGNRLKFYDIYWFGVQSCFLSRCEPVDGKPCRNFLLKSNTKFNSAKITGSFDTNHIYPHVLDSDLRLTDRDEWKFDGKSQMTYKNLKGKNLLHADLYGRLYREDGVGPSTQTVGSTLAVIVSTRHYVHEHGQTEKRKEYGLVDNNRSGGRHSQAMLE